MREAHIFAPIVIAVEPMIIFAPVNMRRHRTLWELQRYCPVETISKLAQISYTYTDYHQSTNIVRISAVLPRRSTLEVSTNIIHRHELSPINYVPAVSHAFLCRANPFSPDNLWARTYVIPVARIKPFQLMGLVVQEWRRLVSRARDWGALVYSSQGEDFILRVS